MRVTILRFSRTGESELRVGTRTLRLEVLADGTLSLGTPSRTIRLQEIMEPRRRQPNDLKLEPDQIGYGISSSGRIVVLFGWARVQSIDASTLDSSGERLFRWRDDDSGFYSMKFLEHDEGVVVVYESGVLAVDDDGVCRWHVEKPWDCLLLEQSAGRLVFSDGPDLDSPIISLSMDDGTWSPAPPALARKAE